MFGKNKILGLHNNDQDLGVVSIFFTIQGEGPFCGMPAIFIRLGGCNLACKFCDTEFDDFTYESVQSILEQCIEIAQQNNLAPSVTEDYISSNIEQGNSTITQSIYSKNNYPKPIVVITGGEPLRQNISNLCTRLIEHGFKVQIETNGLIYRQLDSAVSIVCSPKVIANHNKTLYTRPHPSLLPRIDSLKIIVSQYHEGYNDIPIWLKEELNSDTPFAGLKLHKDNIFLQPMDEYNNDKNADNLQLAIKLVCQYRLRLGLQIHKIIDIA